MLYSTEVCDSSVDPEWDPLSPDVKCSEAPAAG